MTPDQTNRLAEVGQRSAALIAGVLEDDELAWALARDEDPQTMLIHTLLLLRDLAEASGTRRRLTWHARRKAARLADLQAGA